MIASKSSGRISTGRTDARWSTQSQNVITAAGLLLAAVGTTCCSITGCAPQSNDSEPGSRAATISRLEELGATVSGQTVFVEEDFGLVNVTLGPEWRAGNDGLAHVNGAGAIHDLILDCPDLNESGFKHLGAIREVSGLYMKRTVPTDADLRQLRRLKQLEAIEFDGSNVTDSGLEALDCHNPTWLIIDNAGQASDGGLAHLGRMTNLFCLQLSGAAITGRGLTQLSRLEHLRTLTLKCAAIDDQALVHLRQFPRLRRLDLSGTQVRGPGLVHLAELPRLGELTLNDTPLTDEGLQYLAGADSLAVLSLIGTKASAAGVEQLWSLPRLKTVFLADQRISRPVR
jgi:hypothetical protein